jgi:hypothetical protein
MEWLFFQNILMVLSDMADGKCSFNSLPIMLRQYGSPDPPYPLLSANAIQTRLSNRAGLVPDADVARAAEMVDPVEDAGGVCDGGAVGGVDAIIGGVYAEGGVGKICRVKKE